MTEGLGARSDERPMLIGFLDWGRAVAERKLDGLTRDQATEPLTASGLTVLGVVKHLGLVERDWFCWTFAGEDVTFPELTDGQDDAETFAIDDGDTIASVLTQYRADTAAARQVVDAAESLDQLSARESPIRGRVTLRWLLVHMIEETARHAGHLDLMREHLDGSVGD